jgi:hypothetical protein
MIRLHPTLFLLLCLSFLFSCRPENNGPVPADEVFIYSGTFKAIQEKYIKVNEETYSNDITSSPIQIIAEVRSDNLMFTIYGYQYGIFEVNFFINHADCLIYNGSELVDYETDAAGNDLIYVVFPEDFWKRCYFDDEVEKEVSFVLKSEKAVFR